SPASLRLDAAFTGANVGAGLAWQSGITASALWLRTPVEIGAAYTFYPGAVAENATTSLSITRHTLSLVARADARFRRFAVGGSAGPFAELWRRSTRPVDPSALASAPSTEVTAGAFARADLALWIFAHAGISAGAGLELSPASPHFRDASGD